MSVKMVSKHYDIKKEDILAGEYDPQSVIDPLWWCVSIYDGKEQYEKDLAPFTAPQRAVFAIQWYAAEVCNGGHDQFLYNSTGIVWEDALKGFEMIGAIKCAEILRDVVKKCGGSIPFEREERQELLDRITADPNDKDGYTDLFKENDSDFYNEEDVLETMIMSYVQAHAEDFTFAGDVEVPENCL
ncbi:MAG: DMP19 family protein [Oscillospiraceae bacterium]|nr:DMP19 family protein [Oscillospiraceae bacterium]